MALIQVESQDLYRVLVALNGPAHVIRELQVTRDVEGLMTGNPIDALIKQYNEAVAEPESK